MAKLAEKTIFTDNPYLLLFNNYCVTKGYYYANPIHYPLTRTQLKRGSRFLIISNPLGCFLIIDLSTI